MNLSFIFVCTLNLCAGVPSGEAQPEAPGHERALRDNAAQLPPRQPLTRPQGHASFNSPLPRGWGRVHCPQASRKGARPAFRMTAHAQHPEPDFLTPRGLLPLRDRCEMTAGRNSFFELGF